MQHTFARPVRVSGIALHSGALRQAELVPAAPDTGIRFVRVDQPTAAPIPAHVDHVVHTQRATTLGRGTARICTVEHLLATLVSAGIDNAEVRVDGDELPALDGSAADWVTLLDKAGRTHQDTPRRTLVVTRPVEVIDGLRCARLSPSEHLVCRAEIDFDHPCVGRQSLEVNLDNGGFCAEIAWARTFGFLTEVEAMRAAGYAGGGSLDNAIVYDTDKVLNPGGLRSPDEPVRHKILDMLGDLALVGMPVRARFEAVRPGHTLNLALVSALLRQPDAYQIVQM